MNHCPFCFIPSEKQLLLIEICLHQVFIIEASVTKNNETLLSDLVLYRSEKITAAKQQERWSDVRSIRGMTHFQVRVSLTHPGNERACVRACACVCMLEVTDILGYRGSPSI